MSYSIFEKGYQARTAEQAKAGTPDAGTYQGRDFRNQFAGVPYAPAKTGGLAEWTR